MPRGGSRPGSGRKSKMSQGYTEWFNKVLVGKLNVDVGDDWIEMKDPFMAVLSGNDILCSAEALATKFGNQGLAAFKQVYMQDVGNKTKGYSKWTLRSDVHMKVLRYLEKNDLIKLIRERPFSFLEGARYLRMRQVVARAAGRVSNPEAEYDRIIKQAGEDADALLDEVTGWHNINELNHEEDEPWDRTHLYQRQKFSFKERTEKIEPVYESLEEEMKVVEQKIKEHTTKGNYVGDLLTRREKLQVRIKSQGSSPPHRATEEETRAEIHG